MISYPKHIKVGAWPKSNLKWADISLDIGTRVDTSTSALKIEKEVWD